MRTLLGAAIGALVAMFFLVPVDYHSVRDEIHYRGTHIKNLIELNNSQVATPWEVERKINALLLALNVAFSALLGAVCANLSKRVALWTGGTITVVVAVLAVVAWYFSRVK
jgi:hypothetical protein